MVSINKVSGREGAELVHQLVHQIYHPTYRGILSEAQIELMLNDRYTIAALQHAMETEQTFYTISYQDIPQGFMALSEASTDVLRIEKLYLLPSSQGKGLGKSFIGFAEDVALQASRSILELNVNRGNKAYYFYLQMGFIVTQEVDIPYYGYVLDDYIMQKKLV